ncbi:MAG: response regulator transcription factor [Gemmatimonadetes bacterium]|uniref:Response regulator transcription factor n=1 Tax=Candidatus Kutchimonas denitrificans TaxID=3056748 RepID=A0AAE4ZC31_9BACT|nr:response regulator transcription factor [Gemmatimonadota bacterium]NIR76717.1 response regulator transcription factor [Candidatus Kutchimonas denitrificans]NIS01204.1 response regulator transcription factor [Gemmatimonadota bacterium]NIT68243.1 response regulator transcription factor [Gemmatimonadota bacterium]NIW75461.1 response regulator [Gemmatimonadota bacterium]
MTGEPEGAARQRKLTSEPVRVLLVDDHALLRRGLAGLIEQEPDMEVCGEAEDAATALDKAKELEPSLAIVDLSLKDGSGLELIKQLSSQLPDIQLLVFSMHDEKIFAERALRAGARGYVNKEESADKVIEGIREVLAGRIFLSGKMADRILHRLVDRDAVLERSPVASLSDRELEVLELIGKGLTTRQIAEQLHLSRKTIDTYRDHLKRKLQLSTANELVRYAVAWTLGQEASSE